MEKNDYKLLPMAVIGLAIAAVDVMVIQEIKRYRENHISKIAVEVWQEEFFDGKDT